MIYRGIDIFGGYVTNPDWPRRYRNRFGSNRDRSINGALEETRGHSGKAKTTPTTEYRDFCYQRRRGRWESWSHTNYSLDQSFHRWVTFVYTLYTLLFRISWNLEYTWTFYHTHTHTRLVSLSREIYRWIRTEKHILSLFTFDEIGEK